MRQHMSRAERAKQFMPFSALKGYEEAVRESEKRDEPRRILAEDAAQELDEKLRSLRYGDRLRLIHYEDGEYRETEGILLKTDTLEGSLNVSGKEIRLSELYDIERLNI